MGAAAAALVACNPLVYDKILDDVWVENFAMRGPTGAPTHSAIGLTFPPDESGKGHLLMASPGDMSMGWLSLSAGAEPIEQYPTVEDLQALIFPIDGVQTVEIGGLVEVPSPDDVSELPHVVVAIRAPGEPGNARVVRFAVPTFVRTDTDDLDIVAPRLEGTPVPAFGTGLAAINLDGPQDDPAYEVAVGSQAGVFVFDAVGANRPAYEEALAGLDPADCSGDAAPDCFFFTYCDGVGEPTGMTQGRLLPEGAGPAIVVANPQGLTFIAAPDPLETNAVGAPIFDCAALHLGVPGGATPRYGETLHVIDLDADGDDDLLVGDPGANRVHVFVAGDGIPTQPTTVLEPSVPDGVLDFGKGIGQAALGGGIGTVLLIGAPGSVVGGKPEVGKVFVYDALGAEELVVLADTTPEKSSRFGLWVGGLHVDGRDELLVVGSSDAKIYVAISEDDPPPG
jgi:hypothetical protein